MNKTGFGFLRLPKAECNGKEVIDIELLCRLVDQFLGMGGSYFDTAYTYLNGESETALRRTLVERHPRDSFRIATKLPGYRVKKPDDCWKFFNEQIERCGVTFFDVYLLHWLNRENYAIAQKMEEFNFLRRLKAEGLARKIGFSYHDSAELLDEILTQHPDLDYVQLQINYLDWDSEAIQSRKCYQVAVKHGVDVIVMEPVKGGTLSTLPHEAEALLRSHRPDASLSSWAIRFAQSLPQVSIVLSGMNAPEQVIDNMSPHPDLTEYELELLKQVCKIKRAATAVPCTGCAYCTTHCSRQIPIPRYFSLYNEYAQSPTEDWKMQHLYDTLSLTGGKASDCIRCRQCEKNCPQGIPITEHLKGIAKTFENN